jgi:hypothetical protein
MRSAEKLTQKCKGTKALIAVINTHRTIAAVVRTADQNPTRLTNSLSSNIYPFLFRRSHPTRLSKNYFSRVPFSASGCWRDQILVLKTARRMFCPARDQWSAPKVWILPILCTRVNNRHCTSTLNLDRSVKRFMRLRTQMLAKTGSTTPSRLA